jgi:hypothetical protein
MGLRRGSDERVAGFNRTSYRLGVGYEFPASIGYHRIDRKDSALKSERQVVL